MDPELGKFRPGSGSGIKHSGSTTLKKIYTIFCNKAPIDLHQDLSLTLFYSFDGKIVLPVFGPHSHRRIVGGGDTSVPLTHSMPSSSERLSMF